MDSITQNGLSTLDYSFTESLLEYRERLLRFYGQVAHELNDSRIAYILMWRSGFDPLDPDGKDFRIRRLDRETVGKRLGISGRWVSQLEDRAVSYIREHYNEDFKELYAQATQ